MSEQNREQQLHQIISALFEIAAPGNVKNSLWQAYQELQQEPATYHHHYTLAETIILPGDTGDPIVIHLGQAEPATYKTPIAICEECGCPLDDDGTCPACSEDQSIDSPGYEELDDEEVARQEEFLRKAGYPIDTAITLSAESQVTAEPAEMYYCEHCGQMHPIAGKEYYCPLDPNKR